MKSIMLLSAVLAMLASGCMSAKNQHGIVDRDIGAEYCQANRLWQGCPTILVTPKGRLFAGWYSGGSKEPSLGNYNLLVRSDNGGITWSEPELIIKSDKENRVLSIDIQLWLDPDNRMWLFWTKRHLEYPSAHPKHLQTWAIVCDDPDADKLEWCEPVYVAPGFLRCQPTALSDGRWILCAYDWVGKRFHYSETNDKGRTWVRKEGGKKTFPTNFDETMVLERKDGSLWMLARNTKEGVLTESTSWDGGKTWTDGSKSDIVSPSTRFFLRRLKSGNVLLIKNDHDKHRIKMTALLSEDDGKTWKYSLLVDPRGTSYPDAVQDEKGMIYMVHDCGRMSDKEIVFSRFTEDDIKAGRIVNLDSVLCQLISKAPWKPLDAEGAKRAVEEDKHVFKRRKSKSLLSLEKVNVGLKK